MLLTSSPELIEGARKPRIESLPTYSDTHGAEGAELMRRAGKPLEEWQVDAVNAILSFKEDLQWACFEYCEICSRQNGKGAILEARVLTGFLLLGEELIMWSAHEYKTSLEAWRRFKALLVTLGTRINDYLVSVKVGKKKIPIKIINAHGEEGFERLDTNARIKFIARSKGSGRGFSGDLNIIDEAYAYTPDQQEALMPTVLARPNPQIIYASSPPLNGETGEVLYDLRERAERGDTDGLGYRDWGIEGDLDDLSRIDLDDKRLWACSNPALGGRLTLYRMGKLRKSMRNNRGRGFARECLGVWPKRIKGVGSIDLLKWATMEDARSRRSGDISLAFDISPNRAYAAIALFGRREDGLGHYQVIDYRPGVDWLVPRLAKLKTSLNPLCIAAGPGSVKSVQTELEDVKITVPEDAEHLHRGHLAAVGGALMSAACARTVDTVNNDSRAKHMGQDALTGAVQVAQTRMVGDTIAWSRKGDEGDITPLVAVTVAQYGFEVIGPKVLADYDLLDSIG
jgi:hypothetical protein